MNKRTVLGINAGVWLAALTSASAVSYAATRKASLPTVETSSDLQTSIECAPTAPPVSVSQPTLYMPEDSIVAVRPVAESP
jgi:hypothetical protein